ncbi:MAG TPA: methyltransferase domain-containing protein [Candidatus Dormibacteraeota bacterium]|nr:methyltransferase domain-containing protein [Candidatus Dormibacteraeota bacterium]
MALRSRRRGVTCNICGWSGPSFRGVLHSESATCPRCGAIARDRFLYHCWTERVPYRPGARLLETSPRLGQAYRRRMTELVEYLASDYDERAHRADLHLDLQRMDLPDEHLDVILTPHVLEHVPDTDRALAEMYRVLKPGGCALIAVPVPQARTAPPPAPEYHGDRTLVYWRFGWDLTDRLEDHGFETTILVLDDFLDRAREGRTWESGGGDVDPNDLVTHAGPYLDRMVAVASVEQARRLALAPSFYFIVWEARKPAR